MFKIKQKKSKKVLKQAEHILHIGASFQKEGKLDEAITCYQKAIQLNPTHAGIYHSLGNALQLKGELDEAITCYQKAITLNPHVAVAYNNLGNVLQEKGQLDQAIIFYQKALNLDPNFAMAGANLEIAIGKRGPRSEYLSLTDVCSKEGKIDEKLEFKVSAIVSTYNSERFIRGCLEDLVKQTLYEKGELEIIVIDSNSQQNEGAVVSEFQQEYPNIVYIRTEERESLYGAWNRGIKVARGEYITNANTDDRHRQDALEVLCNALDNNHRIQLVYANCYLSFIPNQTYDQNPKSRIFRYPRYFAPSALLHFQFGPQPMWRRELHDRIGYFDDNYHAAGDFDFNIRFALKCDARHISEILGVYLAQPGAITFKDDTSTEECTRVVVTYRTSDYIIKLYQNAGIPCNSASEKALALLDMGIRAMEYYAPWKEGSPAQDIGFAMQCFYWSADLVPTCLANYNNIAVALYLRNERYAASDLLNDISKYGHDVTVTHNLGLLTQANLQPNFPNDLKLIESGLQFPTQKELYFD